MRRLILACALAALGSLALAPAAMAEFGLEEFEVTFTNADGSPVNQAGAHPFAMTTSLQVNTTTDPKLGEVPDESVKDLIIEQIPGLVGSPATTPRCSTLDFLAQVTVEFEGAPVDGRYTNCPDSAAIGTTLLSLESPAPIAGAAVYNLEPPPGVAMKIGFWALNVPVTVELGVGAEHPFNVVASVLNIAQPVAFFGSELTVWGNPADPAHDPLRGHCVFGGFPVTEVTSNGSCPTSIDPKPFLTLPRACEGPLTTFFEAASWVDPADWVSGSALTPPGPFGFTGCGKLGFSPSISAQPTTKAARSPTGLDFSLDVKDEGLANAAGLAGSDIKRAVVTLPEGMSANPSLAEGLEACSEAQLARETAKSPPGAGCPEASKIGSVEVETPLLDESVDGFLYLAKPFENPFDSLLALYIVIKNPTLGIVVRQPLKVEPDPVTGRLTTVADDLPQLPFSHFRLHFREGTRSPISSPPACGAYDVEAKLTPWAEPTRTVTTGSTFQIVSGPDGSVCPPGGLPPFRPGLIAGTENNTAGSFSPFYIRLSRSDSEQELTRFSFKLPRGVAGIVGKIPYCADAAIEAAKARSGEAEIAVPSCPPASEIGHTLAGAGVGPSLAYAPGKLYLAGPYRGSTFSVVAITAAKVGPFDLGTVVVRQGFEVDRETAEVTIDATRSDPIPHIIDGIPVHVRDIRAYVDRPKFTFNPTSCKRDATLSTVFGSGLDFGSSGDDNPVTVSTPFQASDCAALRFKPKLSLRLRGGTKRGDHPGFRAVLRMRGGPGLGEANTARARVTLPSSAFLDQAHIRTICTRVQFGAGRCPPGSIYGRARAITPILDEPLEGPVYLRSSDDKLPNMVATLRSEKVTVDLVGRIDSLRGRIRSTFAATPDAPVTKFVLTMRGGKKGLIVNSTDVCRKRHRAIAEFDAQNGRVKDFRPELKARCKAQTKRK